MATFKNDYLVGKTQEITVLEQINKFFEDDIKQSNDKYCSYDFIGTKYIYELKSRNNLMNAYPTTIIGGDKIIDDRKQIFLFKFLDGLYYIKKNNKLFKTFVKEDFVRNKRSDFIDMKKQYIFIPVDKLTKIDVV